MITKLSSISVIALTVGIAFPAFGQVSVGEAKNHQSMDSNINKGMTSVDLIRAEAFELLLDSDKASTKSQHRPLDARAYELIERLASLGYGQAIAYLTGVSLQTTSGQSQDVNAAGNGAIQQSFGDSARLLKPEPKAALVPSITENGNGQTDKALSRGLTLNQGTLGQANTRLGQAANINRGMTQNGLGQAAQVANINRAADTTQATQVAKADPNSSRTMPALASVKYLGTPAVGQKLDLFVKLTDGKVGDAVPQIKVQCVSGCTVNKIKPRKASGGVKLSKVITAGVGQNTVKVWIGRSVQTMQFSFAKLAVATPSPTVESLQPKADGMKKALPELRKVE